MHVASIFLHLVRKPLHYGDLLRKPLNQGMFELKQKLLDTFVDSGFADILSERHGEKLSNGVNGEYLCLCISYAVAILTVCPIFTNAYSTSLSVLTGERETSVQSHCLIRAGS